MDCRFADENYWVTIRAAAIIIENDSVLVAKNDRDPYYYSVGGAVKCYENTKDAVLREVYEETGYHYEIERLVFIHENFFKGLIDNKGLLCHEICFYYLMKPQGIIEFTKESYGLNKAKEKVCLIPIKELDKHLVYPTFFQDKLSNLTDSIEHIVTYE